jgi:hypothetical protein
MTSGARPATVTVRELTPTILPSVQLPTGVGTPAAVRVAAFVRVPSPLVTAMLTGTPPRIVPFASLTENDGALTSGSPAVPVGASTEGAIEAGAGGAVVSLQAETTTASRIAAEILISPNIYLA